MLISSGMKYIIRHMSTKDFTHMDSISNIPDNCKSHRVWKTLFQHQANIMHWSFCLIN